MPQPKFNSANLLDALIEHMKLRNDSHLASKLDVPESVISKTRHGVHPIGASMLIRMHEASGLSIRALRALMGDHREKFFEVKP